MSYEFELDNALYVAGSHHTIVTGSLTNGTLIAREIMTVVLENGSQWSRPMEMFDHNRHTTTDPIQSPAVIAIYLRGAPESKDIRVPQTVRGPN